MAFSQNTYKKSAWVSCRFDSIIYMDDKNKQAIYEAAQHWKVPTDKVKSRVKSMMSVSLVSV